MFTAHALGFRLASAVFTAALLPCCALGFDATVPSFDASAGQDTSSLEDAAGQLDASGADVDLEVDARADVGPSDVRVADTSGSAVCGNGVREDGEVCDGAQFLPGASCTTVSESFIGGELACSGRCTFDSSGCFASVCGDGLVTGGQETCEEGVPLTVTCETLGFAPGVPGATVSCDTAACQVDTSLCVAQLCGNNNVETGEECDGSAFTATCRSLGRFGGNLRCDADCSSFDASGCVDNICGNGTIEGPEVCDTLLFEDTCRDLEVPADRLDELPTPGAGGGGSDESGPVFFAGGSPACIGSCREVDTTGCFVDPADIGPDADRDGIGDDDDNCLAVANPRQLDIDADGTGNVCDDALVFDLLVEEEGANVIATTSTLNIIVTDVNVTIELPVARGEVIASFNDEGGPTIESIMLEIGETTVQIDLGDGGGIPLPIPITLPTDVELFVQEGLFESSEVVIVSGTSFSQYLTGTLEGSNASFDAAFALTTSDGATPPVLVEGGAEPTIASSQTSVELYADSIRITFSDPDAALGTVLIPLDLNALLPIPAPIPGLGDGVEAELIGMYGTMVFSYAR